MAKPFPRILKWFAVGLLLAGFAWLVSQRGELEDADRVVATASSEPVRKERISSGSPGRDWYGLISLIDGGAGAEEVRARMSEIKGRWIDADPHAVAESIATLLRSGDDRETGIEFETGHGGGLRGWPTLRVFLLDALMSTDPDIAVELAREILADTNSAEEYAVAMRALVMERPWRASDEELEERLRMLLGRSDWQEQRRAGFAEALDLPREIASDDAFESLVQWVDTSPEFEEAGEMALHEFAADHSAVAISELADDSTMLAENPGLRAGLMARADPADPEQLQTVEAYLADPAVSQVEKRDFLKLFPLRSATTGFRLYGGNPKPFERESVIASDRAAAIAVDRWLQGGFESLQPELEALGQRLENWQRQAATSEGP